MLALIVVAPALGAMCTVPPQTEEPLRVCTRGGEGCCSGPTGLATLQTLRFLTPVGGPTVVGCSCLARCDRGVAVRRPTGEIDERINSPAACASLLRSLGCTVDQQLAKAYAAAQRGDELVSAGREAEAIPAYQRAFKLSVELGLGLEWRKRTASAARLRAASEQPIEEPSGASSSDRSRARAGAQDVTLTQLRWLSSVLLRRSRVHASLSRKGLGQISSSRRALQDAQYAVQLAESALAAEGQMERSELEAACGAETAAEEEVEECLIETDQAVTEGWEGLAEAFEASMDIRGAIYAYERLLELEPPNAPGLKPAVAAKRGVQEIVLLSHRRGLEDSAGLRRGLRKVGVKSRRTITAQGLQDVESLRQRLEGDIGIVEEDLTSMKTAVPTVSPVVNKALADLAVIRKIALSDINRLQLTLVRGDPLLSFLQDALNRARGLAPPPLPLDVSDQSEAVFWLKEQFDKGAIPNDPQLVSALLEQAKSDPDLVARLVAEAKDARGLDIATRVEQNRVEQQR